MHCQYCDSDDHPWFNCRKRPEGWKPPKQSGVKVRDAGLSSSRCIPQPPDTKSTAARKDVQLDGQRRRAVGREGPLATAGFESHPVQPAGTQAPPVDTKFDKVAYQRDYMRKRRAIAKAKASS